MRPLLLLPILLLVPLPAAAQEGAQCASPEATEAYRGGFAAQRAGRSGDALTSYKACLVAEEACVPCWYEIGWSYWSRGAWDKTVEVWGKTLELDPKHPEAGGWLKQTRDNQKRASSPGSEELRIAMGATSSPAKAPVKLELVARFQNYNSRAEVAAGDHYDQDVFSPKSVRFSADGSKAWVNSLEGLRTVVYDAGTLQKTGTIAHRFGADDAALFQGESTVFGYRYGKTPPTGDPNRFQGKPVESELSHGGRFLWVPYYRRSWDGGATSPSAVAIIDTATDTIVRVMPTGPIPKYVEASPDGRWVAIAHWGDNTLGLIDTSSGDPATFAYRPERLVVERALSQEGLADEDRDKACGFCLRGTVFTPDSRTLMVARMGGGGVAGFDVESGEYLGTVLGMKPTPRHLAFSPDGAWLYLSSNVSGHVSRIPASAVLEALAGADGSRVKLEGWEAVYVGAGARTIDLSPDGRWIYAAVNGNAEVVVVNAETMSVVARVRTDSFTVGLAVSPDGSQVWTTSQGRGGEGGNSVCVYRVTIAK